MGEKYVIGGLFDNTANLSDINVQEETLGELC